MAQIERSRYGLPRRNYTVQVQQTSESPGHPQKKTKDKPQSRQLGLFGKIIRGVFVLAVLAAFGFGIWHTIHRTKDPIPAAIKQSVSFPLYYPTTEPAGYTLDSASISNSSGTIFYNLVKSPGGPLIVVSQQPTPKNFDPKSLFQHNPLPTTVSPLGTIYDLSYKNQSRFMIDAAASLIFISSNSKITNSQLEQIINGLKTSN